MKDKNPYEGFDYFGPDGENKPIPKEVLAIKQVVEPLIQACSHYLDELRAMHAQIVLGGRFGRVQDVAKMLEKEYLETAVKAVEVTCLSNKAASLQGAYQVVENLDKLATWHKMYPQSWAQYCIKAKLRDRFVVAIKDYGIAWERAYRPLKALKRHDWLITNAFEFVDEPTKPIEAMISTMPAYPDDMWNLYKKVSMQWLGRVRNGESEMAASVLADRWMCDGEIPKIGIPTDASIDAWLDTLGEGGPPK